MAERGAKVLGVEIAPRMAEIARRQGTEVEVAAFEDWEPAGRRFDRVTSAQAWHWLDLPMATAKAASVLRPGGRLCLIWNAGSHPDDLSDALAEVYQSVLPSPVHAVFRGYAANRSTDRRSGLASEVAAIAAVPDFSAPTENGSRGPRPTRGTSGWSICSPAATTPPSTPPSKSGCSKVSVRLSMISVARS